jgi:hypothetical protein
MPDFGNKAMVIDIYFLYLLSLTIIKTLIL